MKRIFEMFARWICTLKKVTSHLTNRCSIPVSSIDKHLAVYTDKFSTGFDIKWHSVKLHRYRKLVKNESFPQQDKQISIIHSDHYRNNSEHTNYNNQCKVFSSNIFFSYLMSLQATFHKQSDRIQRLESTTAKLSMTLNTNSSLTVFKTESLAEVGVYKYTSSVHFQRRVGGEKHLTCSGLTLWGACNHPPSTLVCLCGQSVFERKASWAWASSKPGAQQQTKTQLPLLIPKNFLAKQQRITDLLGSQDKTLC